MRPTRIRPGFSLLEAIAVIILLGVVSAVVISIIPASDRDLSKESDRLISHIRYAQVRAQSDTYEWRVVFTSPTRYEIGPVVLPGAGFSPGIVPADSGQAGIQNFGELKEGATVPSGTVIRFDSWGRPIDGAGVVLANNQTITLTSGSQSQSFTILANTGLIQ